MLKNAPTSAIGGVDTAENEPLKFWGYGVSCVNWRKSTAELEPWEVLDSGLKKRSTRNLLFHTSTSGSFSAVSMPMSAS